MPTDPKTVPSVAAAALLSLIIFAPPASAAKLQTLQSLWQDSIHAEMMGDYEKAAQLIEDYRLEGGNRYLAAVRCGWLCYLKEDFADAIDYYEMAMDAAPRSLAPALGLADVHLAKGDNAAAARACETALLIDPNHYTANMKLGQCQFRSGDFESAAACFRTVHWLYPDDTDAASWLAWSLYSLGEKGEAAALFRTVLTLSPKFPRAEEGLRLSRSPRNSSSAKLAN